MPLWRSTLRCGGFLGVGVGLPTGKAKEPLTRRYRQNLKKMIGKLLLAASVAVNSFAALLMFNAATAADGDLPVWLLAGLAAVNVMAVGYGLRRIIWGR